MDLVTFAEEILNGKFHFLCSVCIYFASHHVPDFCQIFNIGTSIDIGIVKIFILPDEFFLENRMFMLNSPREKIG